MKWRAWPKRQNARSHRNARALLRSRLRFHDHAAHRRPSSAEATPPRPLQVLVMLLIIWWIYDGYAWLTNAIPTDLVRYRLS